MKNLRTLLLLVSIAGLSWMFVQSNILWQQANAAEAIAATRTQLGSVTGNVTHKRAKYRKNTVVYIEQATGDFAAATNHVVVDQKSLKFVPHVLPVIKGSTVDFLNSDNVRHNVFTPTDCADKFNLGTWAKGKTKSYTFKKECVVELLCKVHAEMQGFVVVMQNPYFAVTDKQGNYIIKGIPAGKYVLKVWNEKYKASPVDVEVTQDKAVTADFSLKR